MKNILKISLLITLLAVAFILLGSTNVNAATSDISIIYDGNGNAYDVYNFGDIDYGNPSKDLIVNISNTSNSDILIINYLLTQDYFNITKSDGSALTTPFTIPSHGALQIRIQLKKATETNFPRNPINTTFSMATASSNSHIIALVLKGTDVKNTVETPVINQNDLLTYNGIEQTMNFYTYNGTDYTLVDFNAADSMYTITGNTATTAGTYTAQITLKNPTLYKWDDSLSANLSGANNETYSIEWEMQGYKTPTPPSVFQGKAGEKLSTVTIPTGWTWDAPTTEITVGTATYPATFTPASNQPNHATVNGQIAVNGKNQYSISFNLTSNSTVDALQNPDYLMEGDTKTYTLSTESGYLFTSIKINGIEQLSNGAVATRFPINITNIDKDYVINAETEQIKFSPMEGYDGLTCDRYTDKTLQIKWDLDFDNFEAASVKINGKNIYKGFKFLSGSVILELDSTVLASLSLGENKIEIELASGELAVATFNLIDTTPAPTPTPVPTPTDTNTNNPETGDNIVTYTIIGLVSIICITGIIIIRKKLNK